MRAILPCRDANGYTPVMNWDRQFLHRLPLFEPLREHGARFATADWPTLNELQAAFDARGVVSGAGVPLRVVAQDASRARTFDDRYEARLFLKGELQVRERNWHDVFNALAWLAFPRAKAAVNARHYQALLAQQAALAANRGATQDALTLFDEGGVIVACSEPDLLPMLRAFEWKRLFWRERERVINHMRWLLFGHAIYEKALTPFVGITGRAVLLTVDGGFFTLNLREQMALLDTRVAALIAHGSLFKTTRELAPVPILGVPGWWPENREEVFYDNTGYFRPGRGQAGVDQEATARIDAAR